MASPLRQTFKFFSATGMQMLTIVNNYYAVANYCVESCLCEHACIINWCICARVYVVRHSGAWVIVDFLLYRSVQVNAMTCLSALQFNINANAVQTWGRANGYGY